jgi:hypothetical protein
VVNLCVRICLIIRNELEGEFVGMAIQQPKEAGSRFFILNCSGRTTLFTALPLCSRAFDHPAIPRPRDDGRQCAERTNERTSVRCHLAGDERESGG